MSENFEGLHPSQDLKNSFSATPLLYNEEKRRILLEKKAKTIDIFKPSLDEFVDIIPGGKEEIERDKQEVEDLKKKFNAVELTKLERAHKEIADLFEGVIANQLDSNEWLGDARFEVASEYDDYKHGIDVIGSFTDTQDNNAESLKKSNTDYFALNIDATYSRVTKNIERKLDSIKAIIRSGARGGAKLPFVKYYKNSDTNERASFYAPKVVMGTELSKAEDVILAWGDGKIKDLREHDLKYITIIQIQWQARYFYNFAKRMGNDEAAHAYALLNNRIYDIYEAAENEINKRQEVIAGDAVTIAISDYIDNQI